MHRFNPSPRYPAPSPAPLGRPEEAGPEALSTNPEPGAGGRGRKRKCRLGAGFRRREIPGERVSLCPGRSVPPRSRRSARNSQARSPRKESSGAGREGKLRGPRDAAAGRAMVQVAPWAVPR